MHEPIVTMPPGSVVGSVRLARGPLIIDVTRLRYGSMTTFVEKVMRRTPEGPQVVAFRRTDAFPADRIADRFIGAWLNGVVKNQKYRVLVATGTFEEA